MTVAMLRSKIARLESLLAELDQHRHDMRTELSALINLRQGVNAMTREQALTHVAYCVDDALSERDVKDMPTDAKLTRLIGWQCGFEPLFVAVWSYLDLELDDEEAEGLAVELLIEKNWFKGKPRDADYII
jgi:hypothetical protein